MMHLRTTAAAMLAALFVSATTAGHAADAPALVVSSTVLPAGTLARLHWAGKKRLAKDSQAAYFMRLWNLPESTRLENQTVDRLSLALAKWLRPAPVSPQTVSPLLRSLLAELVEEDCYLEIRTGSSGAAELVLAVHNEPQKYAAWEKNLASIFGLPPAVQSGQASVGHHLWNLALRPGPDKLELSRTREWTLLSLFRDKNTLLNEVVARIDKGQPPVTVAGTTNWLEGGIDFKKLSLSFGWRWNLMPDGFPIISVAVTGDGENVRTSGKLTFPKTVSLDLKPWNLPTNLLFDPLVSFTAVRGIGPWLSTYKPWTDLQLGNAPDQVFVWAQDGLPFMTYCAAYLPNPKDFVHRATDHLVQGGNDWLTAHSIGRFQRSTNYDGVDWRELAVIAPLLKTASPGEGSFAFGGLIPGIQTNHPAPPTLIAEVLSHKDLVYYDWELTPLRIDQWLHVGQLMRVIFQKPQFPSDSAAMAWLNAIGQRLRNCATIVTKTGPQELTFVRKSGLGLSGVEIHALGDWLESPDFPKGLHSLNAAPPTFTHRPKLKPGAAPQTPVSPQKR